MAGITLNSSMLSLTAQRHLAESTAALGKAYQRLSSGLRINSAVDDAAGLAISTSVNADARVLTQAMRNVNDGVSMLNIAEGALHELSNINIRLKELAGQAANGIYSIYQRKALHAEANALVSEFNRISQSATFNGKALFDPGSGATSIQAGMSASSAITFSLAGDLARNVGLGTFAAPTSYTIGNSPVEIAAGDLNSDGVSDLVAANSGSGTISILLGNGDGFFKLPVGYTTGGDPTSVNLVDLNSDGKMDLCGTLNSSSRLFTLLGNGDGSFKPVVTYGLSSYAMDSSIADINGDGKPDAVTAGGNAGINAMQVLLGNGDGSFQQAVSSSIGSAGADVKLVDANNDGRLDALLMTGSTGLEVRLGTGTGSFGPAAVYTNAAGQSYGLETADFNGDGAVDVITANTGTGSLLSVFFGNGDGSFKARTALNANLQCDWANPIDFNSDGLQDIIAGGRGGAYLTLFAGNGDGTFKSYVTAAAAMTTEDAVIIDLNGDGVSDVANTDAAGTGLSVILAAAQKSPTISYLYLLSQEGAKQALDTVEAIQQRVSLELGAIGGRQSRLSVALSNLQSTVENYQSVASRITDVDVAEEAAQLIKQRILQQAAASILVQANQMPQLALKLLQS